MQDDFTIPELSQNKSEQVTRMKKNQIIYLVIFIVAVSIISFFAYQFIAPFGAKITYQFSADKNKDKVSPLSGAEPSVNIDNKAVNTIIIPQQTIRGNIVTFNLKLLSKKIDGAWVNMKFKGNPKELKIGVRSNVHDPYLYKPLYNTILENLDNAQIDKGLIFWQKEKKYNDFTSFIKNPPLNKTTAVYFFDSSDIVTMKTNNSSGEANKFYSINKTLRGKHTLFVKTDRIPFILNIEKQDANSYTGEDVLLVEVYKKEKKIVTKEIPDDGITDVSTVKLQPQKLNIKIDKAEAGVYKVVLTDKSFGSDARVIKVETNQAEIVFLPPIFIVDEKPTVLFTNSNYLTMQTPHAIGVQAVKIDNEQTLNIDKDNKEYRFNFEDNAGNKKANGIFASNIKSSSNVTHKVEIPKNDLVINGNGFFSVSEDTFFNPNPIGDIQLSDTTDAKNVDYIIANYQKVKKDGDWKIAQVYFDPKDTKIDGDKLYFSLEAPGLKESNGEIAINSLEVTVNKPGWFDTAKQNSLAWRNEVVDSDNKVSLVQAIIKPITGSLNSIAGFFKHLWPFGKVTQNEGTNPKSLPTSRNSPTPTPGIKERIKISIQNGGAAEGEASKYADLLKKEGFKNVESSNAPKDDYIGATILYNKDEDKTIGKIIDEIKKIFEDEYKTVNTDNQEDKEKVTIILGKLAQIASPSSTIRPR